jgi:hypothetical protein
MHAITQYMLYFFAGYGIPMFCKHTLLPVLNWLFGKDK